LAAAHDDRRGGTATVHCGNGLLGKLLASLSPCNGHGPTAERAAVTVVLVHGLPETPEIWRPLQDVLEGDAVAVGLPGFGSARPTGFSGTKDAYAEWLAEALSRVEPPVDVVGHDLGALLTMRVASAFDLTLRSWAVDVADVFHPRFAWPERVRDLQTPGIGEEMLRVASEVDPDDSRSTVSRLIGGGVPADLAREIGSAHDEVMSRSILDFYRSAVPNVAADWWKDVTGPTRSRGLVLLLPDPPETETMSLAVAERLGAETARLEGLDHRWMAQAPDVVARTLERFWSSPA
jgi:pimeloyl-ACP methyl ester carboxylesterase